MTEKNGPPFAKTPQPNRVKWPSLKKSDSKADDEDEDDEDKEDDDEDSD